MAMVAVPPMLPGVATSSAQKKNEVRDLPAAAVSAQRVSTSGAVSRVSIPVPQRSEEQLRAGVPTLRTPFEDDYEMKDRVLGTGATGSVRMAVCRRTGWKVAVKSFRLKDLTDRQMSNLRREVEVHSASNHPRILQLEAVYQNEETVSMVLEMLEGGELFERLARCGKYTEADAAFVTVQLLHAVAFLHSQSITHRDIKPENIMYERRKGHEKGDHVKLIDFGFATHFGNELLTQRCGTIQYVAPEVLEGRGYTEKADMWSLGATTYALLTLKAMYSGTDNDIAKKNRNGAVDFSRSFWTLSDKAQDFVQKLLCVDHAKRPTAVEALKHPWLQELVPAEALAAAKDVSEAARRPSSRRVVLTPLPPPAGRGAETPCKAGSSTTTSAATASTATPHSTLSEAVVEEFQHEETNGPPPTCFAAIERSLQRHQSESPKAAMGFQEMAMSALARIGFLWPSSQQLLAPNCM